MARGTSNDSDSDDDLPSYDKFVQDNVEYSKLCTSKQKKLKILKQKLDSSQQAYNVLLEQYEIFAILMWIYLLKLSN